MLTNNDWNRLYRYCYSLTKNEDKGYDLLQSSAEKYLLANQSKDTQVLPFIRKIARNLFIDIYRREKAFQEEPIDDHSALDMDTMTLEQIVISEKELEYVWSILTDSESKFVFLWAVEGMTAQTIAEELSLPKSTILSRIHRLRKKLHAHLDTTKKTGTKMNKNLRDAFKDHIEKTELNNEQLDKLHALMIWIS